MLYFEANVTTTNPPMYQNGLNGQSSQNGLSVPVAGSSTSNNYYPQSYDYKQQPYYQQVQPQQRSQGQTQQLPQTQQGQQLPPKQQQQQQQQQFQQGSQEQAYPYHPKFTPLDIQILKQLLLVGEKHKWKQITKEINCQASKRRGDVKPAPHEPETAPGASSAATLKNVSPTFVIKQYQTLLGLPNNALYFGILGSSLPYVVANNGWDDLHDIESLSDPSGSIGVNEVE